MTRRYGSGARLVARVAASAGAAMAVLLSGAALPAAAITGPGGTAVAPKAAAAKLTPAETDFLDRVKLAGLWEMPAGQMAIDKGQKARVKEIGKLIRDQHIQLDKDVEAAAAKLGYKGLPREPDFNQAYWLREMDAASGATFDRIFVQRLREAHGKIFSTIAAIRASTSNPIMRAVAEEGNRVVTGHMQYLESTGLVNWSILSPANNPAPHEDRFVLFGDPRFAGESDAIPQIIVASLMGVGGAMCVMLAIRVLSPALANRSARPARARPPHRQRPYEPPTPAGTSVPRGPRVRA